MTANDARSAKVDRFLDRAPSWKQEMRALRHILLDCGLGEELKWGKPLYTAKGGNIVIMQPFKAHLSREVSPHWRAPKVKEGG